MFKVFLSLFFLPLCACSLDSGSSIDDSEGAYLTQEFAYRVKYCSTGGKEVSIFLPYDRDVEVGGDLVWNGEKYSPCDGASKELMLFGPPTKKQVELL